jgi:hypothetical protein
LKPNYVYEDDAQMVDMLNQHLAMGRALMPPKIGTKQVMSARISDVALTGLKMIAKELGYTYRGQGNVSLLLEAIGTETVEVRQKFLQPRQL